MNAAMNVDAAGTSEPLVREHDVGELGDVLRFRPIWSPAAGFVLAAAALAFFLFLALVPVDGREPLLVVLVPELRRFVP